jgi:uncharacterized protein (TIGR01619 family)
MELFRIVISTLGLLIFMTNPILSLNNGNDNWDVYLAEYENGAGSTTFNMDLIENAPNKDFPFVVITGVTYTDCNKDGFPSNNEFAKLYKISEDVIKVISALTKMESAGTFTYQCERLDYIYVQDSNNIREKLTELYQNSFKDYEFYLNIRHDAKWEGYLDFLYPNVENQEQMSNQILVLQLQENGDNLSQPRKIDHWIYFDNAEERDAFEKFVVDDGFQIEGKELKESLDKPYSLHISRVDNVDLKSISKVTLELRRKAIQMNAEYDGWETFIIKE